jgi:hypothetical protein
VVELSAHIGWRARIGAVLGLVIASNIACALVSMSGSSTPRSSPARECGSLISSPHSGGPRGGGLASGTDRRAASASGVTLYAATLPSAPLSAAMSPVSHLRPLAAGRLSTEGGARRIFDDAATVALGLAGQSDSAARHNSQLFDLISGPFTAGTGGSQWSQFLADGKMRVAIYRHMLRMRNFMQCRPLAGRLGRSGPLC